MNVLSKKSSLENVKEGMNGIIDSIANSLIVSLMNIPKLKMWLANFFIWKSMSSAVNFMEKNDTNYTIEYIKDTENVEKENLKSTVKIWNLSKNSI